MPRSSPADAGWESARSIRQGVVTGPTRDPWSICAQTAAATRNGALDRDEPAIRARRRARRARRGVRRGRGPLVFIYAGRVCGGSRGGVAKRLRRRLRRRPRRPLGDSLRRRRRACAAYNPRLDGCQLARWPLPIDPANLCHCGARRGAKPGTRSRRHPNWFDRCASLRVLDLSGVASARRRRRGLRR